MNIFSFFKPQGVKTDLRFKVPVDQRFSPDTEYSRYVYNDVKFTNSHIANLLNDTKDNITVIPLTIFDNRKMLSIHYYIGFRNKDAIKFDNRHETTYQQALDEYNKTHGTSDETLFSSIEHLATNLYKSSEESLYNNTGLIILNRSFITTRKHYSSK